jgi:hypothetical protein
MGKALNELLAALGVSILQYFAMAKLDTEWTISHSYFANMGGYVLDFTDCKQLPATQAEVADGDAPRTGDITTVNATQPASHQEAWEAIQRRLREDLHGYANGIINSLRMKHRVWALNASHLFYCYTKGHIEAFPKVSTIQLEKMAQEDTFVKILALIQVLSLIIQLISRKISSLPMAPLEIAALAFAVSSMITYILYWRHPRGVRSVISLKARRPPTPDELNIIMVRSPTYLWTRSRSHGRADAELDLLPMPNDASNGVIKG